MNRLNKIQIPFELMLGISILLWTSLVGCTQFNAPEVEVEQNLIIPGKGVAGIDLNHNISTLLAHEEGGSHGVFEENGVFTHYLRYSSKGITIYFEASTSPTLNETLTISHIELTAPFNGKTAEGIGIGNLTQQVRSEYGKPDALNYPIEKYDIGVSFVYPYGNKVGAIVIENES